MGCSLYWRPSSKAKGQGGFRGTVRDELIRRYGESTIGHDALEFIRGLAAAKCEGAQELIDAIETHGEIDIWQEC